MKLYHQMIQANIKPNNISFLGALYAIASMGALDLGKMSTTVALFLRNCRRRSYSHGVHWLLHCWKRMDFTSSRVSIKILKIEWYKLNFRRAYNKISKIWGWKRNFLKPRVQIMEFGKQNSYDGRKNTQTHNKISRPMPQWTSRLVYDPIATCADRTRKFESSKAPIEVIYCRAVIWSMDFLTIDTTDGVPVQKSCHDE